MDIWSELKITRKFRRVHCNVLPNEEIQKRLDHLEADSRKSRPNEDFWGNKIDSNSNVLEIESDQIYDIAKHLQSSSRQTFESHITRIIRGMCSMLKSGQSHQSIDVRQLQKSNPLFDTTKAQEMQYGCFAKGDIREGTVLAMYVGRLKIEKYDVPSSDPGSKDGNGQNDSQEIQDESQEIHAADSAMSLCDFPEGVVFIDSSECGNETNFINDAFEDSNARYIQADVNGITCIFAVSMQKVTVGDQICAEYGPGYWQPRKEHLSRKNPQFVQSFQMLNSSSHTTLRRERPKPGFYTESYTEVKGRFFPTRLEYCKGCDEGFTARYIINVESAVRLRTNKSKVVTMLPQFCEDPMTSEPRHKRQRLSPLQVDSAADERSVPPSDSDEDVVEDPSVFDDSLHMVGKFLENVKLDHNLSQREQSLAVIKSLRHLVEISSDLESPICQKFFQLLDTCKGKVLGVQPMSVLFLGDTGAGKSFLINLLLLLTAVVEEKYGIQAHLPLQSLAKVKRETTEGHNDYLDEKRYPQDIIGQKISIFEGITELCRVLKRPEQDVMQDLVCQYRGALPKFDCILRRFERPSQDEIESDGADLKRLLMSCRKSLVGDRLQYLLPSQSGGRSTTSHVYKIRFGRILHAIIKFQSEEEVQEDFCSFQWDKNAEKGGDRKLIGSYRKKLRMLYSLDQWPGAENFRLHKMCPAAKKYAGKVVLIAGKGCSLTEDRIFLRKQLFELTSDTEEGSESGGNAAALLTSECIVYAPSDLLESGLELVDSPGTNDEDPIKYSVTKAELQRADAVLVLLWGEISPSVLDMLEATGLLADLLYKRSRPVAFVHTCNERGANLLTNEIFRDSKQSSGAQRALKGCSANTLKKLEDRLTEHYDTRSDAEKMALGSCEELVKEVRDSTSNQTISCLPLLWASNLVCDSTDDHCSAQSNGISLLKVLFALSQQGRVSDASKSSPLLALSTFVSEMKALFGKQCCQPPAVPFSDLALHLPVGIRRMERTVKDRILKAFDDEVHRPFQYIIDQTCSAFLKGFTGRFTQGLEIEVEQERLKQMVRKKRGVAVANAFQKSLKGNYPDMPLDAIFSTFKTPHHEEFKSMINSLCDHFVGQVRAFVSKYLRMHVQNLFSVDRKARSSSEQESNAVDQALSKYVDAYFDSDRPGRQKVVEEFECSFWRPRDHCVSAFSARGLRSTFVRACEKSIMNSLLVPAKQILTTKQTTDPESLKQGLQHLICDNLHDIHDGVKDEFSREVISELKTRAKKLHYSIMSGRVRSYGPTTLIALFQSCIETIPTKVSSAGVEESREMEMMRKIVKHVEECLQGQPVDMDPVDQMVDLIKRRRQPELRASEEAKKTMRTESSVPQ